MLVHGTCPSGLESIPSPTALFKSKTVVYLRGRFEEGPWFAGEPPIHASPDEKMESSRGVIELVSSYGNGLGEHLAL